MHIAISHSRTSHLDFSVCVTRALTRYFISCVRRTKSSWQIVSAARRSIFARRLWPVAKCNFDSVRLDDAIPLVIPLSMVALAGASLRDAIWMWLWVTAASSLFFHIIAFNGAHHHPEIFHEGDAPRYCLFRLTACVDGLSK